MFTDVLALHPFFETSGGEGGGSNNANAGGNEGGGAGNEGQQGEKGGNDGQQGGDKTFTQADIDRIVTDRLKRERGTIRAEVEDEIKREAAAAAAKEQGDYKALLEAEQKDHEATKNKLAEMEDKQAKADHLALQQKVAKAVGIPEELAVKITGETEADMTTDAKAMKKLLAPKADTDIDAGRTQHGRTQSSKDEDAKKWSKPDTWGLPTG